MINIDDADENPIYPICHQSFGHAPGCTRGAEEDAEGEEGEDE